MVSPSSERYEWNTLRKAWHVSGCLVAVALFWQWKDVGSPVSGENVLLVFGWLAAAGAVSIDVIRFVSPKNKAALEAHPVYGGMLRAEERQHFNASTYMVLGAAILVTLWRAGFCRDAVLMAAIAVLGVADPAAAGVRYVLGRRGLPGVKVFGLLAFMLAGTLVVWPLCRWRGVPLEPAQLALVMLLVGLLEAHTGWGVRLAGPLTRRLHAGVSPQTAQWLCRLYPDDNLLIPLATAALLEALAGR